MDTFTDPFHKINLFTHACTVDTGWATALQGVWPGDEVTDGPALIFQ